MLEQAERRRLGVDPIRKPVTVRPKAKITGPGESRLLRLIEAPLPLPHFSLAASEKLQNLRVMPAYGAPLVIEFPLTPTIQMSFNEAKSPDSRGLIVL
jgi:hypothetical protein